MVFLNAIISYISTKPLADFSAWWELRWPSFYEEPQVRCGTRCQEDGEF
jgi:hypothetical protein